MAAPTEPPRHFSMIRGFQLADFITLANAACGTASVFMAMLFLQRGEPRLFMLAALLLPIAFAFDVLDGRVARARNQHSALGRELDSLSDVISFGVAPAALAFAAGMSGAWDAIVLVYFVCCGVSRLARFNVTAESLSAGTGKVKYWRATLIERGPLSSRRRHAAASFSFAPTSMAPLRNSERGLTTRSRMTAIAAAN